MNGDPESTDRESGSRALALAAIAAAVAVCAASLVQGPPEHLPAVALDWPLILYLERAGFVALLITGLGGVIYRLLTGSQVKGTGGGGMPSVDVEDATKPAEALKEALDEGFQDVYSRIYDVEKRLEEVEPPRSPADREE